MSHSCHLAGYSDGDHTQGTTACRSRNMGSRVSRSAPVEDPKAAHSPPRQQACTVHFADSVDDHRGGIADTV